MQKGQGETEKTFLHHASAVAFAGQIQRPFQEPIEARAATVLASSGGFGQACARRFCYKNLIHFDVARSVATGSAAREGDVEVWDTLVSASIENLNIMDQVTAKRVTGHISTRHKRDHKPTTTSIRAQFEDLRIGGHPPKDVDLSINRREGDSQEGEGFRLSFASFFPTHPCYDKSRNVFFVPHFGAVYVAEHVDTPRFQRLTMLRIELGCPVEGRLTACEMESSGLPYPPE